MKKVKWIYVVLIIACIAVWGGYRTMTALRQDTKAPALQVEGPLTLSVFDPEEALLQGVSARDDRDGDVTASIVVESVTMTHSDSAAKVTYAAFDRAGNVAREVREVTYTDYRCPRFSLTQPLIYSDLSSFDVLDRICASDDMDGNITGRIRATALDNMSIANQGIHDVRFRVTNNLGDTAEVVLPVEVVDSRMYPAVLTLTDYLVYVETGARFNPRDYLYEYQLLEQATYLRGNFPEELSLNISGSVDTAVPGVYPVSYTVTGTQQGKDYPAYSKLIVIVEG